MFLGMLANPILKIPKIYCFYISRLCGVINENLINSVTRTTNVVKNTGCACSRYTLKLSLIFFNQSMNESTEYI